MAFQLVARWISHIDSGTMMGRAEMIMAKTRVRIRMIDILFVAGTLVVVTARWCCIGRVGCVIVVGKEVEGRCDVKVDFVDGVRFVCCR